MTFLLSPAAVADLLKRFTARTGHVFWSDDVNLLDGRYVDMGKLLTSGQITDTYLLALAVAHGGQLASLDRRLSVVAVHGGTDGLHLI
jgi:predicted nucleic acid-binding protein